MDPVSRLTNVPEKQGVIGEATHEQTKGMPLAFAFPTALNIKGLSDEELVERYKMGDKPAVIEELVNRYADKAMRLSMRITRSDLDAQEVLQNVFLTLVEKLSTFRGESKFSSWLYRITLNASYMHMGDKSRRLNREISLDNYAPYDEQGTLNGVSEKNWSDLPDEELLGHEGMDIIEKAIEELPIKYRAVFHLGDVEGLSDQEVADSLGLTLSATKSRKRRARLFLRDKLSDYYYDWKASDGSI
ncbi:MAG: RNA polymerase sigma factor [Waddliaceae bacterium]